MKAIRIDVTNKCVELVDIGSALQDLYNALECEVVTAVFIPAPATDNIYIDDESLLKEPKDIPGAFWSDLFPSQPLFGHGLVTGTDPETGELADVSLTVEEVARGLRFLDEEEIARYHQILNDIPPRIISF